MHVMAMVCWGLPVLNALMCYPSSNITYCIGCLLCIGVILLNKFNSIQTCVGPTPVTQLTWFVSHACAHGVVVPGSWCAVHGVVSEHELSVVVLDHSQWAEP